jgi:hypothetical protein
MRTWAGSRRSTPTPGRSADRSAPRRAKWRSRWSSRDGALAPARIETVRRPSVHAPPGSRTSGRARRVRAALAIRCEVARRLQDRHRHLRPGAAAGPGRLHANRGRHRGGARPGRPPRRRRADLGDRWPPGRGRRCPQPGVGARDQGHATPRRAQTRSSSVVTAARRSASTTPRRRPIRCRGHSPSSAWRPFLLLICFRSVLVPRKAVLVAFGSLGASLGLGIRTDLATLRN